MNTKRIRLLTFALVLGLGLAATTLFLTPAPAIAGGGAITGKVTISGRGASSALVYIASVPGQWNPRVSARMDQNGLRFSPRILPIVVGTTVDFLNSDDVQHNIFTPSAAGDLFNLGTFGKGETRSHKFTKMGKVDVRCNVHHEMRGYILVLQNPFFDMTDANGNYRLNGVPQGNYTVKVWSERGTVQPQQVQVSGGAVTVNF